MGRRCKVADDGARWVDLYAPAPTSARSKCSSPEWGGSGEDWGGHTTTHRWQVQEVRQGTAICARQQVNFKLIS
jgi:hypothetical protein